jgi:Phage Terminase
MNSGPGGPLRGDQRPRLSSVPPYTSSDGALAVELAASAGLILDPWQQYVVRESLGRRDGKWAAFEVCLICARQNGKGSCLEALELAGMFLFPQVKLILHSAHEFKTCSEHFRRMLALIQSSPDFDREVARIRTQTGAEAIELKDGTRLRFVARSSGSGRGFTGDMIVMDEAQRLSDEPMAALLPTLSARRDPQVIYAASAGNEGSTQLGMVRRRGVAGGDPSLAFFEWSAEDGDDPADPVVWAKANPAMGIRIDPGYIERERAALSPAAFAAERLTIGRYPLDAADAWAVIGKDLWWSLLDARSEPLPPVALAVAVAGDRGQAAVCVAGRRSDGLAHVEVADYRDGTSWAVPRLAELAGKHSPCAVVVDAAGHEGSFVTELEQAGVEVLSPSAREVGQAFGQFYDAAVQGSLRHRGDVPLTAALGAAGTREVSEGRTWARRGPAADISPLVAVTLALWGFGERGPSGDAGVWSF